MSPVRISVLIPTRNRRSFLAATVRTALAQDHADLEVIVSDNASSDGTWDELGTIRDARLRIIRQDADIGMVANWNACLEHATGEVVILLSDDDELTPSACSSLATAMAAPETIFAYGRAGIIDGDGRYLRSSLPAPARESGIDFVRGRLSHDTPREPYLCVTAFRHTDLQRCGGFPAIGNQSDLALEVRLASESAGMVCCLDQELGRYRLHGGSLTADWRRAVDGYGSIVRYLLEWKTIPRTVARAYADRGLHYYLHWRWQAFPTSPRERIAMVRAAAASGLSPMHILGNLLRALVPSPCLRFAKRLKQALLPHPEPGQ